MAAATDHEHGVFASSNLVWDMSNRSSSAAEQTPAMEGMSKSDGSTDVDCKAFMRREEYALGNRVAFMTLVSESETLHFPVSTWVADSGSAKHATNSSECRTR